MREEQTEYGTRVYYGARDVPEVIEAAREMSWRPFLGWRATLRISRTASDPRYSLDMSVRGRWVFDGRDDDVVRLLGAFQRFLDECGNQVDQPKFTRRCHRPERAERSQHRRAEALQEELAKVALSEAGEVTSSQPNMAHPGELAAPEPCFAIEQAPPTAPRGDGYDLSR